MTWSAFRYEYVKTLKTGYELAAVVAQAAQESLTALGGLVHAGKTQAWSRSSPRPDDFPEAQWHAEGLLLLGTPHGEGPPPGVRAGPARPRAGRVAGRLDHATVEV